MESPESRANTGKLTTAGRSRTQLGRRAEGLALEWLLRHGLELIARNFRCRYGELDLVMREGDCVVFVEVRSRGLKTPVPAAQTVDRHKQQRLSRTARVFLATYPRYGEYGSRFDVLGVDRTCDHAATVSWIRDAFRPSD